MLAYGQHDAVVLALHLRLERAQLLPELDDLALDEDGYAAGDGPEVGGVERAAHTEVGPVARLRERCYRDAGAEVEDGCRAAAVQVAEAVAVFGLHDVLEGEFGLGWVLGGGSQVEVW